MALLKAIQSQHGVSALYWKLGSVLFNLDGSITLRLDGYGDEAARRSGYEPLKSFSYTVDSVDVGTAFPSGFSLVDAYGYVKTRSEFSFGSVDVL